MKSSKQPMRTNGCQVGRKGSNASNPWEKTHIPKHPVHNFNFQEPQPSDCPRAASCLSPTTSRAQTSTTTRFILNPIKNYKLNKV